MTTGAITSPITTPIGGIVPSTVRATIVGTDIQYPLGTSLRKTLRGANWGNYGTVTSANCKTLAAQMQSDGVKVVRLVSNARWFGQYGVAGTDSRDDNCFAGFGAPNWKTLWDLVKALTDLHIWVVLTFDSDCAINGGTQTGEPAYCEAQVQAGETPMILNSDGTWTTVGGTWAAAGGYNCCTSPVLMGKVQAVWKLIAAKSLSYPYILGLELGAEPLGATGVFVYNGAQWPGAIVAMYQKLIDTVRSVDPVTPIVIGGMGYSPTKLSQSVLARSDIIYAFNKLSGGLTDLAGLPASFDAACANNVPLLSDQMGSLSSDDPNEYALRSGWSIANARGIITTWWLAYDKGTNANGYGWRYSDGGTGFIDKPARIAASQYFMTQTLAALESAAQAAATAEGAILLYVKSDFSNAFQADGVTHVTANDGSQVLGKLIEAGTVTGLQLSQGTALACPSVKPATTYLIDQRPVMNFDGVNTVLNGSVAFFASGGQMTVIASGIPANAGTTQDFVSAGSSTGTPKWPRLQASAAKLASCVWQTDTTTATITGATATGGFPMVITATRDVSGNKKLFVNGLQDGATDSTVDGAIASMSRLRVGGNTASNTPTFTGPIGLLCFKAGTMSSANQQAIERFAAYLVGAGYQL